jgi:hypothetical protein
MSESGWINSADPDPTLLPDNYEGDISIESSSLNALAANLSDLEKSYWKSLVCI